MILSTTHSVRSTRIIFSSGHHGALPGSQIAKQRASIVRFQVFITIFHPCIICLHAFILLASFFFFTLFNNQAGNLLISLQNFSRITQHNNLSNAPLAFLTLYSSFVRLCTISLFDTSPTIDRVRIMGVLFFSIHRREIFVTKAPTRLIYHYCERTFIFVPVFHGLLTCIITIISLYKYIYCYFYFRFHYRKLPFESTFAIIMKDDNSKKNFRIFITRKFIPYLVT